MTHKAITTFNQLQLRPLVCMARPSPPPHYEWPRKDTCWYVWWTQEAPVAPSAPAPVCDQKKDSQLIGLCASLIWDCLFFFRLLSKWYDQQRCLPHVHVSIYDYCLPIPRSFCEIHFPLCCAVLPCALFKYIFCRTAYDETEACCYVPPFLKPLRHDK